MIEQKPPSAPPCWGRQYDDNDKECTNQCEYRLSCKPNFFRNNSTPAPAMSLPIYPPQPVPIPQAPAWPQPAVSYAQPQPMRLGVAQPSVLPQYQIAPQNPMAFAQQAPILPNNISQPSQHSAYFSQYYSPYPGESVLERLGKHMVLRLGQILFHELASFLGLWRWPPRK